MHRHSHVEPERISQLPDYRYLDEKGFQKCGNRF